MSDKNVIEVVFDTRSPDFSSGAQHASLINQVDELLRSGKLYNKLEITQWAAYDNGELVTSDDNVHVPIYRHFYHDQKQNKFGGGFMLFELLEDLRRYYDFADFLPGMSENFEMTYTITVTVA